MAENSQKSGRHISVEPARQCAAADGKRIFVSDATLADLLDTSRSTVRRYVKSGILPPPIKIGCLTRFDLEEAVARIRKHAAGATK